MRNRKFSRRLFAVLMVFVMMVGLLPTSALADDSANSPPTVVLGQETQTGAATPASADGSLPAVAYSVYAGDWFTDADNDPLTCSVVSAAYGTEDIISDVSISGGTITYTPAAAQANSTVTILVKASDGAADSTGNVTITVAVNLIPADTADPQPPTGAPVEPSSAETPTFTINLSKTPVTYTVGEAAAALAVAASVTDGGTMAHQWYRNTVSSDGDGTAIPDATAASYTPPTTVAGTVYYYVIATNTLEASTATATSNVATVTVTGQAEYDPSLFEAELAAREAEKAAREAAAEQEYLDMLREAGLELDPFAQMRMSLRGAPVVLPQDGDFTGYVTISLERFAAGTGYVVEPVSYPLYAGDTIANIVQSVSSYKYPNGIGSASYYTNTGSLDRDFVLTGLADPSPPTDAVPAAIGAAAVALGGQAASRQTSGWLKNGDLYSTGRWLLWVNNDPRASSFLTDFSSAPDLQTLQPGDVIRIQYSVTGDGRDLGAGDSKLYGVADKDRLTAKVAELNSWGQDLLTNGAYRSAYDNALAVLKDLQATQQQVDSALLALLNEPAVDLDGAPIDNTKDILMGNIEGRVRVGSEWEVTALDVPRANDDDRNFVRGDLNLEVVQGKDLVSIRRAPGSTSGATGNSNMSRGYTFFVKGLKQGLARIKVSYPTYQGRETYIVIHITDRDSDYTNALHISSSLDYITKYDTIHYDARTQNYPITIDVPSGARSGLSMYVNGSYVAPTTDKNYTYTDPDSGLFCYQYYPAIPLKNGYNTVILSASSGGVPQTRVYQIRASRLTVTLENATRPGSEIYEGDQVKVHFTGMVNPLPKISRLYNPSQGQISYYTDMPFLTQLYGSSSQYDLATSTVSFTATDAGTYSLHDGFLRVVGFGGSGWLETPTSQRPAYRGRPGMSVGGGGPNLPQNFMSYSFLPDVTFTVLENSDYHPVRVAATPDKAAYAPGETATISIPDLDINEIQSHHNFWDEIVDDSSAVPGSQYFQCTAITQASVVYSTDIPGLATVRSREFVDVKKIIDNIRLHTPIIGAGGNEITVINNYKAGAPVADLVPLKTLTFEIPDNTPSGTYKLKGGYVDVEYGPYWWVKYVTYFGGEIADVAITVQREVYSQDVLDGTLSSMTIDPTTAFLYDPLNPGSDTIIDYKGTGLSLNKAYINSYGPTFNWTSFHKEIKISAYLDGKTRGATLEYRNADGQTVTDFYRSSAIIRFPYIPLQMGDNQFTVTVYPQDGSTAPATTYTFNVTRVVDPRVTYYAEMYSLYYTTASPNSDIPATVLSPTASKKGVIIDSSGVDYTSSEPGKSYIEVGYQVEKILLSVRTKNPVPSFTLQYQAYLNNTTVTANGIGFGETDWYLSNNSSPLASQSYIKEPIPLQVGVNVITIHLDAGDGQTAADHYLYVTRLPDVSLKTVDVTDGRLESGGFYPGIGTIKVATSGNAEGKFEMAFTATEGAVISRDNPATDIITPGVPVAFEAPEPIVSGTVSETPKTYPIFVTKTVDEREVVTKYEVVAYRASETTSGEALTYSPSSGSKVSLTDAVKDDDSNPDGVFRALAGAYRTRLGLMGGFVEYKLDNPIDNDPNNKYGIDFVIYGTVTTKDNAFPGAVQVARDADGDGRPDKWYTLAGSEYYSDNTENNLSVTYARWGSGYLSYADDSGLRTATTTSGSCPDPAFSSRWNSIVTDEGGTTFTGTLLSTRNPAFGYADVHPIGLNGARPAQPDKAVNPYRTGDLYSGTRGDGFDLAWAIDANGLPVELDSVDFIRVSSSYLGTSATDVNGTVITSIVDVTGESKSVGESSDLQGLKVNGQELTLKEGVYVYELPLNGPQDVRIAASTFGSNFYVDGEALGHEVESAPVHFDGTNSRVVRLIVQSESKTPKIYYLILEPQIQINTIALDKTSVTLRVGEQVRLTPTITPFTANAARTVNWYSNDTSVAKVSGGLVTAIGEGSATIAAMIGAKSATCIVEARYATVNEVKAVIAALPGTITAADRSAVETARRMYDSLSGGDKSKVTNYDRLQGAEAALAALPDPGAAVDEVIGLIDYLPRTITVYDEADILAARAAYDALDAEHQGMVANYSTLLRAERSLEELKLGQQRVGRVIGKIGLIPRPISFNADPWIRDARESHGLLTDVQQMYVSNYPVLALAEERYAAFNDDYNYDIQRVTAALNAIGSPAPISQKALVLEARWLYNELPAEKQALVPSAARNKLTSAETLLGLSSSGTSVYNYIDQIGDKLNMLPSPLTYGRSNSSGDRKSAYDLSQLFAKISAEDVNLYLSAEKAQFDAINATLKATATGDDLAAIKESFKTRVANFPTDYTYRNFTNASGLWLLVSSTNASDKILATWFASSDLDQSYRDKYNNYVLPCYNAFQSTAGKAAGMAPYVNAVTALGTLDVTNPDHRAKAEALLTAYSNLGSTTFQQSYPDQYAVVQSTQAAMAYLGVKNRIERLPVTISVYDRSMIEQLRADYGALAAALKALVTNLNRLAQAESDLAAAQTAYDGAVSALIAKIASIPETVGLADRPLIEAAEDDYQALKQSQRLLVTNYEKLLTARQVLDPLIDDEAMVSYATMRIDAIETPVELDNADLVRAARAAYNALTAGQSSQIGQPTLQKLTDAELALADLVPGSNVDTEKIQNVINIIDAIPDGARYDNPAVIFARQAYDNLNSTEKQYVINYNKLLTAEQNGVEADQVAANAVIALINQIPDGAQSTDPTVAAARAAYDDLTAAAQALVTNYARLTTAEANVPSGGGGNTITVTFRLIGDSKHGAPENDPESTEYHVAYENWIKTKSYTLPENSTNYDLFARAMSDAHLNFTSEGGFGYEHNYISGIESPITHELLSEFDNGRWSGWMYTVNGVHPNIGLAAKVLANGDKVVWHYMDNFYIELDKQPWLAVPDTDPQAAPENPGNTGGPRGGGTTPASGGASLAPKVTAENGVAAASVNTADLSKAITDAKAKGSDSITIAPDITGSANKVSVDIPKSSLSSIASETDAALTVKTPVGSITIPNGALASIASQATGGTVTVSLETVDNNALTPAQQEAVGEDPVYDINVLSAGKNISGFGGESITISLPYTLKEGEDPSNVTVWYLNDAGELEQIACTYDPVTGLATFPTDHLSYYVVGYSQEVPPPVPAQTQAQTFSDVSPLDWFYDSVTEAVYRKLMNGTSDATFSPNDPMTRAMLVTVLYRLEGSPIVTGQSSFSDVRDNEWYTDAVTWASANNIATGYGINLFGTNDPVTREQMATILYRYAGYKDYDVTKMTDLAAYADAPEISDWAVDALKWANAEGLITGRTASTLAPGGSATRAEVATILMRFVEGFVE